MRKNANTPDSSATLRGRKVEFFALVTSLILLSIGAYKSIINYRFAQEAVHVQGTVIDFQTYEDTSSDEPGSTPKTFYIPIFEYELNGQVYMHKGNSTSSPGYQQGEKVDVLVNRTDPQKALVNSFRERWLVPVIFFIAAAILMFTAWLAKRLGW